MECGWDIFPPEPSVLAWASHARRAACHAVNDPQNAGQFACEGTWFVGIDALNNDPDGRVDGGTPLQGAAVEAVWAHLGHWPALHRAQVSVVYPGYPKPRAGESEAAFRYRQIRDAAHVDGVLGIGAPKRRYVQEPHAFILGLPLTEADADAAPLVVWEGSHIVMKRAFGRVFEGLPADEMSAIDVTDAYVAARREVFETCRRVELHGAPGAALLLHRMTLHGVASWAPGAQAEQGGRMIAYFRPPMPGGVAAWVGVD